MLHAAGGRFGVDSTGRREPRATDLATAAETLRRSRRILVLGSPGSGKSHLARRLADLTALPLVSLDDLYWGPGWQRPDHSAFASQVATVTAGERWILDGNYAGTLPLRIPRAEAALVLDIGPRRCLARVARRGFERSVGRRDSLPAQVRAAPQRRQRALVDLHFLRLVLGFRHRTFPSMLEALETGQVSVLRLGGRDQVDALVEQLTAGSA